MARIASMVMGAAPRLELPATCAVIAASRAASAAALACGSLRDSVGILLYFEVAKGTRGCAVNEKWIEVASQ